MSPLQRLVLAALPKSRRADAEAESRAWHSVCTACSHAVSVWDLGGVRWKAVGNPVTFRTCPACGARAKHTLEKRNAHDRS